MENFPKSRRDVARAKGKCTEQDQDGAEVGADLTDGFEYTAERRARTLRQVRDLRNWYHRGRYRRGREDCESEQ